MRVNQLSNEVEYVYDSISEMAEVGLSYLDVFLKGRNFREDWHGVNSREEVRKLASEGWISEAEDAMEIAAESVDLVDREHDLTGFRSIWDVAGCEVDVGRYLAKEPENMINYEIVPTTRSGRVIVLCASVAYSSVVSVDSIKKRGHGIAALAFALSKLGFSSELWADVSINSEGKKSREGKFSGRFRVQVKGSNDAVDPAFIMFAFCHPAMLRALVLPAMHEIPSRFHGPLDIGRKYGLPADPKEDLHDGAIYLPSVRSEVDVPNVQEALLGYLRLLGILED
ncbi:DUF7192 family protein [Amycolatopsis saalfeldensis]|uniref:DUF7192 domain-containing protein n=1 Tax=Amycolatopsis saalfeldensis TaxID=394193 RepID=A0A1H8YPE9_9PSEU|nr:hypothetical protein [Amycolatopsis saalfeldensis]SEP54056.1 hypothetical protein SAMN04489732_13613 [Amycolatopsis saalfeldensis]